MVYGNNIRIAGIFQSSIKVLNRLWVMIVDAGIETEEKRELLTRTR